MKTRPVIYSLSNPPEDIEEAQKALEYINEEIASAETAREQKKPDEFSSEVGYDNWLIKIKTKITYLYKERHFLENWVQKKEGERRRLQLKVNKDNFEAQVKAILTTFEYKRVYGEDLEKPETRLATSERLIFLKSMRKQLQDVIAQATTEAREKLNLFKASIDTILLPVFQILEGVSQEIRYLNIEQDALSRTDKTQNELEKRLSEETISKLRKSFECAMSPFFRDRLFWNEKLPESEEEAKDRYNELIQARAKGHVAYTEVRSAMKADHPDLTDCLINKIAKPYNGKMNEIDKEIRFLKVLCRFDTMKKTSGQTTNEFSSETQMRISQIKQLLGFERTGMLLWLIDRIDGKSGTFKLRDGEVSTLELIREYTEIINRFKNQTEIQH